MADTVLVLGMTVLHLGVPPAGLLTCALVLALLAVPLTLPIKLDDVRRGRLPTGEGTTQPSVPLAMSPPPLAAPMCESTPVLPATARLTAAEQWQAVARLVNQGAERTRAVVREQQALRRELDSLDFTLENMRRELGAVMTRALPAVSYRTALVPISLDRPARALAA